MNNKFKSNFDQRQNKDNFKGHKGKVRKKEIYKTKKKTWELIDEELTELRQRYSQIDSSKIKTFSDFPLSKKTLEGLKEVKYENPTEIQREAIGLALQGNDILGAAKTGSGKTLAFLIPVLEGLYRLKWGQMDGLGALVISPTRELAYQTFEVLKKIGKFHDVSAGLVIGGKFLREERARINRTNIVICTPGRLLQHMDETVNFTADGLQMLVLDEADRILDLGFSRTMNGIISNLPPERQTMLFSATQTKSVKDLARLSLKDPMYVSVHENAKYSTPTQLDQNYIVCEVNEKLTVLWSFIKNHLKAKILVFVSCCKQVKMFYEVMRRLRPGVIVLELHGGMNQLKRVDVYNKFCRKEHAVLFATDIAARGLDFPAVNWVLQLDCPEDANTYIHRVGRTARYEKGGESLLILLPSEEIAMVNRLQDKKIPVEKIKVNPKKLWNIQSKLDSICAADPNFKAMVQRAFVSYLRSVFLMSNKDVFDVHKINTDLFARSLGLAIPPKVRFLKKEQQKIISKKVEKRHRPDVSSLLAEKFKMSSNYKESDSESENSESDEAGENSSDLRTQQKRDKSSISSSGVDLHSMGSNLANSELQSRDENEGNSDVSSSGSESDDDEDIFGKQLQQLSKLSAGSKSEGNSEIKSSDQAQTFNFDVEDDNDDLFIVKSRILEPDSDEEENVASTSTLEKSREKKPLSKYAIAKKLEKKNVKVNTKIVFDEHGEVSRDVMKRTATVEDEEEDNEGGINIEVAKQRMKEEDKFDKQFYREKIKKKHREEKIKKKEIEKAKKALKAKKRALMSEEFESEEEVEAVLDQGEDTGNPLDFLPDPDKLYGSGSNSDNDTDDDEDDDSDDGFDDKKQMSVSEDDYEGPSPKKRRKTSLASSSTSADDGDGRDRGDDGDDDDEALDTGLSLYDDEELALKLLQNR